MIEVPLLDNKGDETATVKVDEQKLAEDIDRAVVDAGKKLSEPFPIMRFVDPKTAKKHRDDAIRARGGTPVPVSTPGRAPLPVPGPAEAAGLQRGDHVGLIIVHG